MIMQKVLKIKYTTYAKTSIVIMCILTINMSCSFLFENLQFSTTTSSLKTVKFHNVDISCLNFMLLPNKLIINSEEEYYNLLKYKTPHPECDNYHLPEINFLKFTLIGYKTITGGCIKPQYRRAVTKNTDTYQMYYDISIKQRGSCLKGWINMNWILVDKLDNIVQINFNVTNNAR